MLPTDHNNYVKHTKEWEEFLGECYEKAAKYVRRIEWEELRLAETRNLYEYFENFAEDFATFTDELRDVMTESCYRKWKKDVYNETDDWMEFYADETC